MEPAEGYLHEVAQVGAFNIDHKSQMVMKLGDLRSIMDKVKGMGDDATVLVKVSANTPTLMTGVDQISGMRIQSFIKEK